MSFAPIFSGYASAGKLQVLGALAGYHFGKLDAALVYTNTQFTNFGSEPGVNALSYAGKALFNSFELSLSGFVAPSVRVGSRMSIREGPGQQMEQEALPTIR
ncbi:MAG: hypothetical protein AB1704_38985 [Pseudomonadota bacterium]|jgi:hypothetical protein|uniref:hypothetical protein n=1 Tax=Paraburkholderia TaxID=1822464 RepID=UPI0004866032|nr:MULTISPECIES: hypothetical protein [Paraburkholderia]PNE56672.1 hypothetical protein A8H39_12950 [Paraburkholderia fungorum]USU14505.1 hypothetical protein NFE55_12765 [Paraburkholderia fungorum]USU22453.1 hypothetical protein NFS19_12765 [Paraburkholderia fungorum]